MNASFLSSELDSVDDLFEVEELNSVSNDWSEELKKRINDIVVAGNHLFNEDKMDQAIHLYSEACKLCPIDVVVLSNRSAAFSRYSQQLRNRPAALSEAEALLAMDPMEYAELALKDAEKVLQTQGSWQKAYYRKAVSLLLLERYEDARETLLSGLQINPVSMPMQNALSTLDKQAGIYSEREPLHSKRAKIERTDDFDCTLCLKLLYDPVTTPCGHTFCLSCLLQSMDHGNKCPMCRRILLLSPRTYNLSVTLNNIIQKNFPEEYAERKAEQTGLTNLPKNLLPLFVMDVVLPYQKISLNIFEPRYRLMIRRIMEGSHRMGMVGIDSTTNTIADIGCEVEICECEPLPNGRFLLQVEGRQRFKISNSWDQDGYRVAEVEWISDFCPPNGTKEKEDLQDMAIKAGELAQTMSARSDHHAGIYANLFGQAEEVPNPKDPERFSFWIANRLKMRPTERLELLRLTDTRERLSRELIFLGAGRGCYVQ